MRRYKKLLLSNVFYPRIAKNNPQEVAWRIQGTSQVRNHRLVEAMKSLYLMKSSGSGMP